MYMGSLETRGRSKAEPKVVSILSSYTQKKAETTTKVSRKQKKEEMLLDVVMSGALVNSENALLVKKRWKAEYRN